MQEIIEYIKNLNINDLLHILKLLNPIFIWYVNAKLINSYFLVKDYKPPKEVKILLPPELTQENNSVNMEELAAKELGTYLVKFAKVLEKSFPKEYLTNFYNNIKSLSFVKFNKFYHKNANGYYQPKENSIAFKKGVDNDLEGIIYHELFHLASTIWKGNHEYYSGFSQVNIGDGINEGYTEILRIRYFPETYNDGNVSYLFNYTIMTIFEEIIGKDKLEKYYLTSNLQGFIDELKRYVSDEEINLFIHNMDFIKKHYASNKLKLLRKKLIEESMRKTIEFTIKCYVKAYIYELISKNDKITSEEYMQKMTSLFERLPMEMSSGRNKYKIYEDRDADKITEIIGKTIKEATEETDSKIENNAIIRR